MTATAAPPAPLKLRITLGDDWITRTVEARPDEPVRAVKARVLETCRIPVERASEYEVKHGGVPVKDESRSLSALGIRNGAAMIILLKRRRPVR